MATPASTATPSVAPAIEASLRSIGDELAHALNPHLGTLKPQCTHSHHDASLFRLRLYVCAAGLESSVDAMIELRRSFEKRGTAGAVPPATPPRAPAYTTPADPANDFAEATEELQRTMIRYVSARDGPLSSPIASAKPTAASISSAPPATASPAAPPPAAAIRPVAMELPSSELLPAERWLIEQRELLRQLTGRAATAGPGPQLTGRAATAVPPPAPSTAAPAAPLPMSVPRSPPAVADAPSPASRPVPASPRVAASPKVPVSPQVAASRQDISDAELYDAESSLVALRAQLAALRDVDAAPPTPPAAPFALPAPSAPTSPHPTPPRPLNPEPTAASPTSTAASLATGTVAWHAAGSPAFRHDEAAIRHAADEAAVSAVSISEPPISEPPISAGAFSAGAFSAAFAISEPTWRAGGEPAFSEPTWRAGGEPTFSESFRRQVHGPPAPLPLPPAQPRAPMPFESAPHSDGWRQRDAGAQPEGVAAEVGRGPCSISDETGAAIPSVRAAPPPELPHAPYSSVRPPLPPPPWVAMRSRGGGGDAYDESDEAAALFVQTVARGRSARSAHPEVQVCDLPVSPHNLPTISSLFTPST